MNLPAGWVALLLVAAGLAGVAVWAGPNLTLAAPAASGAVLVGSLLLFLAWEGHARQSLARSKARASLASEVGVRVSFRSGPFGREEVVLLLDRIERLGPTPTLPSRSEEDLAGIVQLPAAEFVDWVDRRITDLEGRS
jgi:hypothetical protein